MCVEKCPPTLRSQHFEFQVLPKPVPFLLKAELIPSACPTHHQGPRPALIESGRPGLHAATTSKLVNINGMVWAKRQRALQANVDPAAQLVDVLEDLVEGTQAEAAAKGLAEAEDDTMAGDVTDVGDFNPDPDSESDASADQQVEAEHGREEQR